MYWQFTAAIFGHLTESSAMGVYWLSKGIQMFMYFCVCAQQLLSWKLHVFSPINLQLSEVMAIIATGQTVWLDQKWQSSQIFASCGVFVVYIFCVSILHNFLVGLACANGKKRKFHKCLRISSNKKSIYNDLQCRFTNSCCCGYRTVFAFCAISKAMATSI